MDDWHDTWRVAIGCFFWGRVPGNVLGPVSGRCRRATVLRDRWLVGGEIHSPYIFEKRVLPASFPCGSLPGNKCCAIVVGR